MNHLLMSLGALLDRVQPLLLDSLLKGTAVLILAMTVLVALRKDSAARRHLAWLSALTALLLLPAWSALLPGWRILPCWPVVRSPAAVSSGDNAQSGILLDQPLVSAPPPADTTIVRMLASPPTPAETSFSVPGCFALVWAAGFAFLLMGLLAAHYLLRRTGNGCALVTRGRLPEMAESLGRQLGIRQPVHLLLDSRRTIPMVCGVRRPRLLLPAQAVEWDDRRLRLVLHHELAHVQRWDTALQWLTQFVCALHWCNPLVWFAAWRIQIERERACDDVVLAGGAPAAEYAEHLLYVATKLSLSKCADVGGLAMARPSQLENRLAGVLNQRINRRGVARPLVVATLVLTLGGVIPLAMLEAADGAPRSGQPLVETIMIEAKAFEADSNQPLSEDVANLTPADFARQVKSKGLRLLSAPRILTKSGQESQLAVGTEIQLSGIDKDRPAGASPDALRSITTGFILRVVPVLKGDRIAYTGQITLRDPVTSDSEHSRSGIEMTRPGNVSVSPATKAGEASEIISRDLYISGTAKEGEGIWFHFNAPRDGKWISVRLQFKRQNVHASVRQSELLTEEEARRIAIQLANAKAFAVYRCDPFGNGRPARFELGHWVWIGLQGYGTGDIQATVELAPNGSTNAVNLEFLNNLVMSKGF